MPESIRVVDRAFDILEALSGSRDPLSLADISKATGLSKSTAHRILASLVARQYVEHDENGGYRLGYKLIEIASSRINSLELLAEAKPCLSRMLWDLNLTTHMGVLEGADVVYMEKMDVYPHTRLYTQVGYRSPAFCSSMGKCLLSSCSRRRIIPRPGLLRLQALHPVHHLLAAGAHRAAAQGARPGLGNGQRGVPAGAPLHWRARV